MQWDIFCRVIDNLGDIGVCWRLAADLAARGEQVRLWADDPSALAWMAPRPGPGVEVLHWRDPLPDPQPGEVVVEAFGCDPPEPFVRRMALRPQPPVWINLEYLSAEPYVERSHGLRSPVSFGAGSGLHKWFFYPGFTPRTGGLLRERGLLDEMQRWRRDGRRGPWLARHAAAPGDGELVVVLFCYAHAYAVQALAPLLAQLRARRSLLLVAQGQSAEAVSRAGGIAARAGETLAYGAARVHFLPHLAQPDFDRLLWSADLNFVRGEDSFVRAQWAGCPFVWQIYPQDDGAHAAKLDAFLDRMLDGAGAAADGVRRAWRAWNGWPGGGVDAQALAREDALAARWRTQLAGMPDLCANLLAFVQEKRQAGAGQAGTDTNPP